MQQFEFHPQRAMMARDGFEKESVSLDTHPAISDYYPPEAAYKYKYEPLTNTWRREAVMVAIQSNNFQEGTMRRVYKMKDLSLPIGEQDLVAKLYKNPKDPKELYFNDVRMQWRCSELADEFNKCGPPKNIRFIETVVIEFTKRRALSGPGPLYMTAEPLLRGCYKKHSNNYGFVDPEERNTPFAFSHFTYDISRGKLLICDIQGVAEVYTDPQIHSATKQGVVYGKGDMGVSGIEMFFKTHKCNILCAYFGLKHPGKNLPLRKQITDTTKDPNLHPLALTIQELLHPIPTLKQGDIGGTAGGKRKAAPAIAWKDDKEKPRSNSTNPSGPAIEVKPKRTQSLPTVPRQRSTDTPNMPTTNADVHPQSTGGGGRPCQTTPINNAVSTSSSTLDSDRDVPYWATSPASPSADLPAQPPKENTTHKQANTGNTTSQPIDHHTFQVSQTNTSSKTTTPPESRSTPITTNEAMPTPTTYTSPQKGATLADCGVAISLTGSNGTPTKPCHVPIVLSQSGSSLTSTSTGGVSTSVYTPTVQRMPTGKIARSPSPTVVRRESGSFKSASSHNKSEGTQAKTGCLAATTSSPRPYSSVRGTSPKTLTVTRPKDKQSSPSRREKQSPLTVPHPTDSNNKFKVATRAPQHPHIGVRHSSKDSSSECRLTPTRPHGSSPTPKAKKISPKRDRKELRVTSDTKELSNGNTTVTYRYQQSSAPTTQGIRSRTPPRTISNTSDSIEIPQVVPIVYNQATLPLPTIEDINKQMENERKRAELQQETVLAKSKPASNATFSAGTLTKSPSSNSLKSSGSYESDKWQSEWATITRSKSSSAVSKSMSKEDTVKDSPTDRRSRTSSLDSAKPTLTKIITPTKTLTPGGRLSGRGTLYIHSYHCQVCNNQQNVAGCTSVPLPDSHWSLGQCSCGAKKSWMYDSTDVMVDEHASPIAGNEAVQKAAALGYSAQGSPDWTERTNSRSSNGSPASKPPLPPSPPSRKDRDKENSSHRDESRDVVIKDESKPLTNSTNSSYISVKTTTAVPITRVVDKSTTSTDTYSTSDISEEPITGKIVFNTPLSRSRTTSNASSTASGCTFNSTNSGTASTASVSSKQLVLEQPATTILVARKPRDVEDSQTNSSGSIPTSHVSDMVSIPGEDLTITPTSKNTCRPNPPPVSLNVAPIHRPTADSERGKPLTIPGKRGTPGAPLNPAEYLTPDVISKMKQALLGSQQETLNLLGGPRRSSKYSDSGPDQNSYVVASPSPYLNHQPGAAPPPYCQEVAAMYSNYEDMSMISPRHNSTVSTDGTGVDLFSTLQPTTGKPPRSPIKLQRRFGNPNESYLQDVSKHSPYSPVFTTAGTHSNTGSVTNTNAYLPYSPYNNSSTQQHAGNNTMVRYQAPPNYVTAAGQTTTTQPALSAGHNRSSGGYASGSQTITWGGGMYGSNPPTPRNMCYMTSSSNSPAPSPCSTPPRGRPTNSPRPSATLVHTPQMPPTMVGMYQPYHPWR